MRYYTIVKSSDFVSDIDFTWGSLFDVLDSRVAASGYIINSGRYVSTDPYANTADCEHVSLPGLPTLTSGQLIELNPATSLWGL